MRLSRVVVAAVLAMALPALAVAPVAAECDGPFPSFRVEVAAAKRIVIGDVAAVTSGGLWGPGIDGRSSRFTLRVRHVLRGVAPSVLEIRDLPTGDCTGSVLVARTGDRIALALDATDYAFPPPFRINMAAWIRGVPPAGFQTVTLAEVSSFVGLRPPNTATAPVVKESPVSRTDGRIPLLGAAFVAGLLVALRRPRRARSERA